MKDAFLKLCLVLRNEEKVLGTDVISNRWTIWSKINEMMFFDYGRLTVLEAYHVTNKVLKRLGTPVKIQITIREKQLKYFGPNMRIGSLEILTRTGRIEGTTKKIGKERVTLLRTFEPMGEETSPTK